MKKLSGSFALLAVVFALASAFTVQQTADWFKVNSDQPQATFYSSGDARDIGIYTTTPQEESAFFEACPSSTVTDIVCAVQLAGIDLSSGTSGVLDDAELESFLNLNEEVSAIRYAEDE
jgi:hypothetical protein